jgi:hypothetical protein
MVLHNLYSNEGGLLLWAEDEWVGHVEFMEK